jgi:hypothetical protein
MLPQLNTSSTQLMVQQHTHTHTHTQHKAARDSTVTERQYTMQVQLLLIATETPRTWKENSALTPIVQSSEAIASLSSAISYPTQHTYATTLPPLPPLVPPAPAANGKMPEGVFDV